MRAALGLVFAMILAGTGCAVQSADESEGGEDPGAAGEGKADQGEACFAEKVEPIGNPDERLIATGDIPLPALGPTADGWFHPRAPYAEGGTFVEAEQRSEWSVDEASIAPPPADGTLRVI